MTGPGRNPALSASAGALAARSREALRAAARAAEADERFRLAHVAALRAAGAMIAARGGRARGRRRLQSAWVALAALAPELAEQARAFAASARERATIEAGGRGVVSGAAANRELCRAEALLRSVEQSLGQLAVPLAS